MYQQTVERCVAELREIYEVSVSVEGGNTFVKIKEAYFPQGCSPPKTEALVILDQAQPKPRLLVRHKPTTPKGVTPRNVSPEMAVGEAWFGFSYNVVWDEGKHSATQFVESALRRFAKDE